MPAAIPLDPYLVAVLMPDLVGHDRRPSAFLVYLHLWSRTHGTGQRGVTLALADMAEATGLAKRTVQNSLEWLVRRQLLTVRRSKLTDMGDFVVHTPWRRVRP